MKRAAPILALVLVMAYLGLAVVATVCVTDHAEGAAPQHHPQHGGSLAHSSFCAWACQANPTSGGPVQALVSEPILLSAVVVQPNQSVEPGPAKSLRVSRAPPAHS